MQVSQSLIFCESEQLLDVARSTESLGYTGVVLPDHMVLPEQTRSSYPYSDYELDPQAPFLEAWPVIDAMAAVTDRLRFSTYVYVLPMRDPFSVAKSVATTSIPAAWALLEGNHTSLAEKPDQMQAFASEHIAPRSSPART